MHSTSSSNRSPPQSRSGSPWYSRFPCIDPPGDYSQNWPPQMLRITDPEIWRLVLLPKTGRSPLDPSDVQQNERTEYLGHGILTALVSDFLYFEFIEYTESGLLAMREALLDPVVLSNICQRIDLPQCLPTAPADRYSDEQPLALLFEAYIGGLYHNRGAEGYSSLRDWFCFLIKPYAMMCKNNYDQYIGSHRDSRNAQFASPSRRGGYSSSGYPGYGLADPYMITRPGTAAPDFGAYGTSHGAGRGAGDYIQELKEFCEKRRWAQPVYLDTNNQKNGDFIEWFSSVSIDGGLIAESPDWAKSKKMARATASKMALNKLRNL
ncbi:hypothetical protein TWF106_011454 [Orbilia oligospora]|uniref:RNase III domain-containing protein n=2 Tax=Orbilia oligospora TaxID=2813651 RepID=A0A6G1ME73_ORBOL|nr:hypothetical protein TWF788_004989 [Orbilia oligospora]KAF3208350.1 hypothetical protein TWF106_011454 [Orbilia oligospora]KAF3210131.1 hypothetical protein TWF679_006879 [Orbilia oligospora]KAF3254485.1 hypothetical protein TWF192_003247 [Orbilia oligospora]